MGKLRIFSDAAELSRAVAEAFVERASATERFSVALAGGSTPRRFYELLATDYRGRVPWKRIHFFWSDERYVPLDHADSNTHMVRQAFLDRVGVPEENIHVPPVGLSDLEGDARQYEEQLRDFFGTGEPRLNWVLLGLGEDGHIASLFPGSSSLAARDRWVIVVRNSPKPPPIRLTMTLPLINRAEEIHVLVTGEGKAEAVSSTIDGPHAVESLPAQNIKPIDGTLTWWLDDAAASKLISSK
jgi:6-phosphogluconolactonase